MTDRDDTPGATSLRRAFLRRRWPIVPAGLAVLILAAASTHAEPVVPGDDAQVLDILPTARDPTVAGLRRLQAALAKHPDNLDLAVAVAERDVAQARARFDPRFNAYAEAALGTWWNLAAPPVPVRLLRATVRQSNHDFDAALVDLDAVIAASPDNAQALLTRAVVYQVRAAYPQATADCRALEALEPSFAALICLASVQVLGPDVGAGAARLADAVANPASGRQPTLKVWALTVLAETAARRDDAASADSVFRAAQAIAPDDGYLLGAYADYLLDQRRPAEVVTLLRDKTQIDPLLLRLALAERALGDTAAPNHVADLADRFAASRARGETVHRREEARFMLDILGEPEAALALATANWQVQREPADARVLLEAALAAGNPAAAAPARQWLARSGIADRHLQALDQALNQMLAGRVAPANGSQE